MKFKISTNASSTLASTSKEYTLTVTKRAKYALSSLLKLTSTNSKLSFTTDTANKKVTIKVPWGISLIADSLKAKITATTSTGAVATWKSVVLNGKNTIPFNVPNSSLDTIKVTSESGVVTTSYPVNIVQKNAFTSFTLNDSINGLSASSQLVTINNAAKTIEVMLFGQSSVLTKGYIATFVGADYGTVTINNVKQVSGTTKNYYPSTGLVFTITSKETNLTTTYTVTLVQVAKKK